MRNFFLDIEIFQGNIILKVTLKYLPIISQIYTSNNILCVTINVIESCTRQNIFQENNKNRMIAHLL